MIQMCVSSLLARSLPSLCLFFVLTCFPIVLLAQEADTVKALQLTAEAQRKQAAGQIDEAYDLYSKAEAIYTQVGDVDNQIEIKIQRIAVLAEKNEFDQALKETIEGIEIAKTAGSDFSLLQIQTHLGYLYVQWGKMKDAQVAYETAWEMADEQQQRGHLFAI